MREHAGSRLASPGPLGTTLWTFADPANNGLSFGIYLAGTAVSYLAVLAGAIAIRAVKLEKLPRSQP